MSGCFSNKLSHTAGSQAVSRLQSSRLRCRQACSTDSVNHLVFSATCHARAHIDRQARTGSRLTCRSCARLVRQPRLFIRLHLKSRFAPSVPIGKLSTIIDHSLRLPKNLLIAASMALSLATAMPAPPPLKPTFLESAASFFETDDNGVIHLRELDDNQLEELEEADRTLTESAEFRIGAASTHDRLDRHLLEYRQSMIIRFKFEQKDDQLNTQDPKTNANDSLFFPRDNNDQVYANVGWYLTWVSRRLEPRDRKDKAIKLPTLASRRWSMLHWMKVRLLIVLSTIRLGKWLFTTSPG